MDFLRRHTFILSCVTGGVGGLALMITGHLAMPKVRAEMEKTRTLYQNLDSVQSSQANQEVINAEERRIRLTREDHDRVMTKATSLESYRPLAEGVFPQGNDESRRTFRKRYQIAMHKLLDAKALRWGSTASKADISAMKDKIVEEQYRDSEHGLDPGAEVSQKAPAGPVHTPAGVLTIAGAKADEVARADMVAAQRIFCYATPFDVSARSKKAPSLQFDQLMKDTGTVDAPLPEECWMAQVGYWIQKDVVSAIAAVNNDAAEKLKAKGKPIWVAAMPIKDIISVRYFPEYIPAEGDLGVGSPPQGYDAAEPPGTPEAAFTRSGQTKLFDVVQYSVKLVMDQREIPRFVQKLTANSFHTLLRIAYEKVPTNLAMRGRIYGSGPVVIVVMDFEMVMLGEVFRPMMPPEVCEQFEIDCPEPETSKDDEG